MRGVVLCVVAAIGINAIAAGGPAGVSMTAENHAYRSAIPSKPAIASVAPSQGEVVGVGHPVVVTFSAPVSDKRAAERAIDITSSPATTGSFKWLDDKVAQWFPDRYWPA